MTERRSNTNRKGAAVVEMAIVLPIFVLVSLGIIEFGRAMMVSQLVTNSAREGARLAMLTGSTNIEVEQAVKNFLVAAADVESSDVSVTITVTPALGNPSAGNEVANASIGDLCAVEVHIPFSEVEYIASTYLTGKTLKGYCAMRHE